MPIDSRHLVDPTLLPDAAVAVDARRDSLASLRRAFRRP